MDSNGVVIQMTGFFSLSPVPVLPYDLSLARPSIIYHYLVFLLLVSSLNLSPFTSDWVVSEEPRTETKAGMFALRKTVLSRNYLLIFQRNKLLLRQQFGVVVVGVLVAFGGGVDSILIFA